MAAKFYLRESFGVPVPSDYLEAKKKMKEYSRKQMYLNEKMETVLNVIIEMEQASSIVRDEELYSILNSEHGIGEDEALDLILQLMKRRLIDSYMDGCTRISV